MLAKLGPVETILLREFGTDDFIHLMDMYISIEEDYFDEWYESIGSELAEHISDISQRAEYLTSKLNKHKLLH